MVKSRPLTIHNHQVTSMGRCVSNHTMLVHQPVVHVTKLLSDCEWSTPDAHQLAIQFWANTRAAPMLTIPDLDLCCTLSVLVGLSSLCS